MIQKKAKGRLKKTFKIITSIFVIFFVVLLITTPSRSNLEDWVYENYGYQCDEFGVCQKDNTEVLVMGQHYRIGGIFMSVQRSIEIPGSNEETETIKAFGILNKIYSMEDNRFFEIVN
ncbi:hypothetical protein DFR57_10484 [Saliterribacillus persicus]|uniref:Uncharacterized protein n=2 Tax=Saliterribacillus persicus TaxID=930114 RepID=A0A368Y2P0_9BACI|nr:hypothetical protein DFR57_10484 [Saliterribacillus persicus]